MTGSIEQVQKELERQDQRYSETTRIIFGKIDDVASSVGHLSNSVTALVSDIKASREHAPKPAENWRTIATVAACSTVIGAVFTWLGFFVDSRINAKTDRAVVFAEEMTKEGKLYVEIALMKRDLQAVQDALAWKPTLVEAAKR